MSGEVKLAYSAPGFVRDALRIARKDLLIEFRTRSAFVSAAIFAVLSVAIFRFTWDQASVPTIDLAPGVLWVIFTFSGLLGLHRSFGVELADRALDALMATPMSRESVFAGKALANLAFVACVQALALPAVALFFNLPSGVFWLWVMLAGSAGRHRVGGGGNPFRCRNGEYPVGGAVAAHAGAAIFHSSGYSGGAGQRAVDGWAARGGYRGLVQAVGGFRHCVRRGLHGGLSIYARGIEYDVGIAIGNDAWCAYNFKQRRARNRLVADGRNRRRCRDRCAHSAVHAGGSTSGRCAENFLCACAGGYHRVVSRMHSHGNRVHVVPVDQGRAIGSHC